jgi:hypothetical protein
MRARPKNSSGARPHAERRDLSVVECDEPPGISYRVAYVPPPFDSFGRSVTVTVVLQENTSCAAFVAEHETPVVPIRN